MSEPLVHPSKPLHWILDWDGTLTRCDTLNALVTIASEFKSTPAISETWKSVSQDYMDDYTVALKSHAPNGNFPITIAGEKKLLKQLEEVEQRSIDRVSESKLFEGLTQDVIRQGAEKATQEGHVELREGCKEFITCVYARSHSQEQPKDRMNILSVNWSRRFISACLNSSAIPLPLNDPDIIYANELEGIDQGLASTGRISPRGSYTIHSSAQKLEYLHWITNDDSGAASHLPVVYVGDSWTDFECLLAADLGICVRDDPMTSSQKGLAEALERVGVPCSRLNAWKHDGGKGVAWVRDFAEIKEWLGG